MSSLAPLTKPKILMLWPVSKMTGGNILESSPLLKATGGIPLMPPLGLMTVAGCLPPDWDIKLIDLNREDLRDEDLAWSDYVFLSGFFTHAESIQEIAEKCGKIGKPTLLGGPFITISHPTIPGITSMCYNEAEAYIEELKEDLVNRTLKPAYGLEGKRPDLTKTAIPRFDLLKNGDRYIAVSVQTSRGCPFDCEFCEIPEIFGKKMRYKSPEQVLTEFDAIRKVVKRGTIMLWDDNFIGSPKQAKVLLRAIAEWQKKNGYPYVLMPQMSTNVADDAELVELLYQANARSALIGIETVNEESLNETRKYQNLKRSMIDRVHTLIKAGIEPYGYMIIGFDHDNEGIFDAHQRFVKEARMTVAETSILIANSHTDLHRRIKEADRMIFDPADVKQLRLVLDHMAAGVTNFKTSIPAEKLQKGYADHLEALYEPDTLYARAASMVEMLPDRDKDNWENSYWKMNWNFISYYMTLISFLFMPKRWTMLKHAWRISRGKGNGWRWHRYILSVMTAGMMCVDYNARIKRIRANPYKDMPIARGERISPPLLEGPRARLPVVS